MPNKFSSSAAYFKSLSYLPLASVLVSRTSTWPWAAAAAAASSSTSYCSLLPPTPSALLPPLRLLPRRASFSLLVVVSAVFAVAFCSLCYLFSFMFGFPFFLCYFFFVFVVFAAFPWPFLRSFLHSFLFFSFFFFLLFASIFILFAGFVLLLRCLFTAARCKIFLFVCQKILSIFVLRRRRRRRSPCSAPAMLSMLFLVVAAAAAAALLLLLVFSVIAVAFCVMRPASCVGSFATSTTFDVVAYNECRPPTTPPRLPVSLHYAPA